jgi:hypothetical protein
MLNLEPFWLATKFTLFFTHAYNNTTRCSLNTQTNPKEEKEVL